LRYFDGRASIAMFILEALLIGEGQIEKTSLSPTRSPGIGMFEQLSVFIHANNQMFMPADYRTADCHQSIRVGIEHLLVPIGSDDDRTLGQ
jgi:hypothetical protein